MYKVREILGDAFQEDIKGPWKIVSIIYCLELDPQFMNCLKCG